MGFTLNIIAVILVPVAFVGFVTSQQVISGDQYVAVLEILGSSALPGLVEIFGADIKTVAAFLDFFETWSLPLLLTIAAYGIFGFTVSKDRVRASFQTCLGLFFSFGFWALLFSQALEIFTRFIGEDISDLSALIIAQFLTALSSKLLTLTGLLALVFGGLALGLWLIGNRRKARSR
jgi:hypothetical protein